MRYHEFTTNPTGKASTVSAEATGWTWRHSPFKTPARFLIHLAIADVVNDGHGNEFWMSNIALAGKTGTARETVTRVLDEMKNADPPLVTVLGCLPSRSSRFPIVNYRFEMPDLPLRDFYKRRSSDERSPVTSDERSPEPVTTDHTELKRTQEQLNGVADAPQKRKRKPDPVWDALMETCELDTAQLTKTARGAANRARKELVEVGATPDEVVERGRLFRREWPDMSLTPMALAKQWAHLGNGAAAVVERCGSCGVGVRGLSVCPLGEDGCEMFAKGDGDG